MRGFKTESTARKWARFAFRCGLLFTDPKTWTAVGEQLRDRADDVQDEAKRRYDETTGRLQDARDALQGRKHWVAPTMNFLCGIGVGMGLGILFAPVSGEEARSTLKNKVVDFRNRVGEVAADATGFRSSAMNSPATGSHGD